MIQGLSLIFMKNNLFNMRFKFNLLKIFFGITCWLTFSGCNKSGIPFGANGAHFSCLIDGKAYAAKRDKGWFMDSPLKLRWVPGSNELTIDTYNSDSGETIYLYLLAKSEISTQNYMLTDLTGVGGALYGGRPSSSAINSFHTSPVHTGYMLINTINPKKRIIEGCFAFDAINDFNQEIVHVTKGKFSATF